MGMMAGLGLGLINSFSQARQQKRAQAEMDAAAQQNQMAAMQAQQKAQQDQFMMEQQRLADKAKAEENARKLAEQVGPTVDPNKLNGLSAVTYTSPLGDPTAPVGGRQRLLGGG